MKLDKLEILESNFGGEERDKTWLFKAKFSDIDVEDFVKIDGIMSIEKQRYISNF